MNRINNRLNLNELQSYVQFIERERGFSDEGVLAKCLLLGEEVGELYKAVRKHLQMKLDPHSEVSTIASECADVLVMLCAIANRMGVDLETAFREKEEMNKKRIWKQ